jgi:predicted flap endonuclease-1-like 5' DNA nuclease
MASLLSIEGIGPEYAKKLRAGGCTSTGALLEMGGTAKGRKGMAAECGVAEKLILEWVNRADLMRVKGVGEQYSDLLEQAGVDSVAELATRKPANLTAAMAAANEKGKYVRSLPSETVVAKWVAFAKTLKKAVHH